MDVIDLTPTFGVFDLMRHLYRTGAYSDLEIRAGDFAAKVHKNVVCTQSEWFAKAVKDDRFVEGQNNVVNLPDTPPHAARALVQYMYGYDYELSTSRNAQDCQSACQKLLDHLDIYALADMLLYPDLRATAKRKFMTLLHENLHTARLSSRILENHGWSPVTPKFELPRPGRGGPRNRNRPSVATSNVQEGALHTETPFLSVVVKAFEVSPLTEDGKSFRSLVFGKVRPHVKFLFKKQEDFDAVVERVPELGKMVWNVLVEEKSEE